VSPDLGGLRMASRWSMTLSCLCFSVEIAYSWHQPLRLVLFPFCESKEKAEDGYDWGPLA
jgi:hypothetical protein